MAGVVDVVAPRRREGAGELVRQLEDLSAAYKTATRNLHSAGDVLGEVRADSAKVNAQLRDADDRLASVRNYETSFDRVIVEVEMLEKELPYPVVKHEIIIAETEAAQAAEAAHEEKKKEKKEKRRK